MSPEPMGLFLLLAGGVFYTAGVPFNVGAPLGLGVRARARARVGARARARVWGLGWAASMFSVREPY